MQQSSKGESEDEEDMIEVGGSKVPESPNTFLGYYYVG